MPTRLLLVLGFLLVGGASVDAQVTTPLTPSANIVITPRNLTLATGAVEQFSATMIGDDNVDWQATGGSITTSGVYTAGSTAGTFTVTARTRQATSTIAVTIVSGPTPARRMPVEIRPGDDIQRMVDANPPGTFFLLKRGIHRRQRIYPKNEMSFVGEAGAVLDGENVAPNAFLSNGVRSVTVRGLRITRYAPPALNAALDGGGSQDWIVEGNEIDHNANGELRTYGMRIATGWIVRANTIHHNGWVGIAGYQAFGALIEGNDIFANPGTMIRDTIGEAANIKLFDCGGVVIRGNQVHDGPFRGIWLDSSRPDMTVEGNRVINHGAQGIWYEVSYRGVIRNNYVENAGYNSEPTRDWPNDAGIQVTNSPDVSVLDNHVVNSLNGIVGHQARGYPNGAYGLNELRNLVVKGNTVVMPRGQTGIAENIGTSAVFVSWNNWFGGNRYVLGTNPTPFFWMGRSLDERQWQAFGYGTNDAYSR